MGILGLGQCSPRHHETRNSSAGKPLTGLKFNFKFEQRHSLSPSPTMSLHTIRTPLCDLLKLDYPVMLAGMAGVTGPKLVAAASNCGGIGTIGAIGLSPEGLKKQIEETKALLREPGLPFGVDLLLPKVGKGAKKTNKDYTGGKLGELVDIVIESGASLFVCAVGVPPKWESERGGPFLHIRRRIWGWRHCRLRSRHAGRGCLLQQEWPISRGGASDTSLYERADTVPTCAPQERSMPAAFLCCGYAVLDRGSRYREPKDVLPPLAWLAIAMGSANCTRCTSQ